MKLRLLTVSNSAVKQIGLRIVAIIFAITFLQSLPQGQLPTTYDLYRGIVAGIIAALLLLEKGNGTSTPNPNIPLGK